MIIIIENNNFYGFFDKIDANRSMLASDSMALPCSICVNNCAVKYGAKEQPLVPMPLHIAN